MVSVPSVSVSDAALRLGVSEQRVRAMVSAGAVEAEKVAGVWLISVASLARALAVGRPGGRPFSLEGAWSLLLIASGEPAEWASPKVRRRASMVLRERGLAACFGRLARRGERLSFRAHAAELPRLAAREELMLGGISAAGAHRLGLQGGEEVEAYVAADAIEMLVESHGLTAGGEGNVVLRVVPDEAWSAVRRPVAPLAAVLADLSEHPEARSRRVGIEAAARLDRERTGNG